MGRANPPSNRAPFLKTGWYSISDTLSLLKDMNKIDNEDFIRVWQVSNSIDEVVRKTGWEKKAVYRKATHLRKNKVPLKPMSSEVRNRVDWGHLARLATELVQDNSGQQQGT